MDNNQQAADIAKKMIAEDQLSKTLGIEIVTAESEYSVCKMTVSDVHVNGHGSCHGGAIFALADTTFAHICNANNSVSVAHMCTIAFWRPGELHDTLYAVAQRNGDYGRSGSYYITVHKNSEDGDIIAEFNGYSRSLRGRFHFPEDVISTQTTAHNQ